MRLGNAATARLTTVGIDGARTFIVAVDGQPSEPFEPLRNQFPMGPGARFELMIDMPREASATVRLALKGDAGAADQPFVTIATEGEPVAARSAAARLPANPLLPAEIALEASRRYDFAVTGGGAAPFALNGATFVDWSPKPAFAIPRGAPSVFAIANKTAVVQAMRLGGHVARLLHSMDDGWEPYWRDTILIQPGRTAHVAFVADNPGKWPIESAIPEHRAAGRRRVVSGRMKSRESLLSVSPRQSLADSPKPEFSLLFPANRGTRASPHSGLMHEDAKYQSLRMIFSCNG